MKVKIRKIEVVILVLVVTLVVIAFTSGNYLTTQAIASIGGPPASRTGAPGESTCTSCHSQNTGSGQFSIIAPANYTPGQTYQIQVRHIASDPSRQAWGFELTSLAGTAPAGTLANTAANTRIRTGNGRTYIEQNSSGVFSGQTGGASWVFNWTAPATDVGNVTFYAAGLQADDDGGEGGDQTYTTSTVSQPQQVVVIHHGFSDFDGDGKADASVFRPSDGTWFVNRSTLGFTAAHFGISTDKITPADFDGDDKTDIAVWREAPGGEASFYILQSSDSVLRYDAFGQTGDKALAVGDWDGDGKADPAVYRDSAVGSQSYFYYRGSLANPGRNVTFVPWGTTGDKPMHGDFDGDGKADAAVFRPGSQAWYILQSSNNQLRVDYWGLASDKFVPADFDGDSKTDLAVFRGGVWYIKQSSDGQLLFHNWGIETDVLAPADYDGDARTDPAVYRGGIWYIRMSASGSMSAQSFGLGSDIPVPGAFVQ
jgi:hypothetical protein